jgi:hypothetical protein
MFEDRDLRIDVVLARDRLADPAAGPSLTRSLTELCSLQSLRRSSSATSAAHFAKHATELPAVRPVASCTPSPGASILPEPRHMAQLIPRHALAPPSLATTPAAERELISRYRRQGSSGSRCPARVDSKGAPPMSIRRREQVGRSLSGTGLTPSTGPTRNDIRARSARAAMVVDGAVWRRLRQEIRAANA